jgi:pilus assembly protein FimV
MGKEHGGSASGSGSLLDSASSLVDLSSINLDLPASPATGSHEADLELGANTQQRGRWQEMATKLDLASAYEEIGDKEGARELLDEVIKGGDASQQQRARGMLTKLG